MLPRREEECRREEGAELVGYHRRGEEAEFHRKVGEVGYRRREEVGGRGEGCCRSYRSNRMSSRTCRT